jgi:hypothetical protein
MANSITSAALLDIQAMIEEVFQGDTPNKYPYNEPGFVAGGLMERNAAQLDPVLNSGGLVRGFDIHYLTPGSTTITQNDTPANVKAALDCDVDEGQFPTSAVKTLNHNKAIVANVTADDNLVGSLFNDNPTSMDGRERAGTLIQERFQKAFKDLRQQLDYWLIDFLHASRTGVNNDSALPSHLTFNGADDRFEAAASYFQNADFLTDIDAMVANNDIMDYFMVSGRRNFYNAVVDSRFRRENDHERYLTRFDTAKVFFDIRNMDARLATATGQSGAGFTFAVGEGTYAIWNYADIKPVPVLTDTTKQTWAFTVQDPRLMINFNGVLQPVTYEVLYQKVCVNRGDLLTQFWDHRFEIRFLGGVDKAPASADGHTGILEMMSIAGV